MGLGRSKQAPTLAPLLCALLFREYELLPPGPHSSYIQVRRPLAAAGMMSDAVPCRLSGPGEAPVCCLKRCENGTDQLDKNKIFLLIILRLSI